MAIQININETKIGQIEKISLLSLSQSYLKDRKMIEKKNQGFGQIYGDKSLHLNPKSLVDDNDLLDANSYKKVVIK